MSSHSGEHANCLFCKIADRKIPSDVVFEDEKLICFMDINPVSDGHCLVVPKNHSDNFTQMEANDASHLITTSQKLGPLISQGVGQSDFNFISNAGANSGQIIFHTHFHIIPRPQGSKLQSGNPYPSEETKNAIYKAIKQRIDSTQGKSPKL